MKKPLSLAQFHLQFGDDLTCRKHLHNLRWPDGIYCPFCGHEETYTTTRGYRCANTKKCGKKFTLTVKTIFDSSKLPLNQWFLMMYLMCVNKKNTSSVQMAINLGITQLTAWVMMGKIRELFWQDDIILSGVIEVDESFLGRSNQWKRWGGVTTRKEPIMGLVERGGKVVIKCMPDRRMDVINKLVREYVEEGSTIYTDGWIGYGDLKNWYNHDYVDHGAREYARGVVHTGTMDGIWRQLKCNIRGAHHSIAGKNVQDYCNEVAFRINNRDKSPMERFDQLLQRAVYRKSIKGEKYKLKIAV